MGETTHANIIPETLGIRFGQNFLYGHNRVLPSDLHKPDMRHPVYLGLFKHLVALRLPGSAQLIPFKGALRCVRGLVDFNMMAQYRSLTAETITHTEDYLDTFHNMNDLFLEFPVTKRIWVKINQPPRELRHDRPKTKEQIAPLKRCWIGDAGRAEETE